MERRLTPSNPPDPEARMLALVKQQLLQRLEGGEGSFSELLKLLAQLSREQPALPAQGVALRIELTDDE